MLLAKYTDITNFFNELLALNEIDKQKGIALKKELNDIYVDAVEVAYAKPEEINEYMNRIQTGLDSYKKNLLDVFSTLDKNNADIFMLMENLRSSGFKAGELATNNVAALMVGLNNQEGLEMNGTDENNNEETVNEAAKAFKEEIKDEVKNGEAEKSSDVVKCNCEDGITIPLWAGVAGVAAIGAIGAYFGYKYGYAKGQDECSVIIINNGGNE